MRLLTGLVEPVLAPLDALPPGARVVQVACGTGGLSLALARRRPDLRITLVEPLLRRTTFLDEVVADLGLDHVEVVRCDQDDGDAVLAATRDVEALLWISPSVPDADPVAAHARLGGHVARAVTDNGVARTVFLSSVGAEKRHGAGEIDGLARTEEALELDPDVISTACPFCLVMLGDAVTAKKQDGSAREDVEVLDVSQLLLRSVQRNITVVPVDEEPDPAV